MVVWLVFYVLFSNFGMGSVTSGRKRQLWTRRTCTSFSLMIKQEDGRRASMAGFAFQATQQSGHCAQRAVRVEDLYRFSMSIDDNEPICGAAARVLGLREKES